MAQTRKFYKRRSTQKKATVQTVKSMITKRTDWAYEPFKWKGDYSTVLGSNYIVRQCVSPAIAEHGVTIQKNLKLRMIFSTYCTYRVLVVQDKGGLFTKSSTLEKREDTQFDRIFVETDVALLLPSLLDPENTNFNILLDTIVQNDPHQSGCRIVREWNFNKLLPLKRNPVNTDGTGNIYVFTVYNGSGSANNQFDANTIVKYSA